ncbi:MAG: RNA polymerase sigma factor region1.1 domain-containing protein, partial [Burkholderiaceae bacterium]
MVTKKTTAVKAKAGLTGATASKAFKKLPAKAAPAKAEAKSAPTKAPAKANGKAAPFEAKAPVAKAATPVVAAAPAPRGRPGRKPKQTEEQLVGADAAVPEAGDDAADPGVQIVEKMTATKVRAKDRRAKEKALKEALERSYHGTEEDLEARRNKLKALIKLGKERGFLTYAEINDHLPDDILDAEQIEGVISMIGDMGIQVYDEAPDA